MRLLRSLFYNMALGKFLDVQAAFGASGLHAKLVDASLELLRGPATTPVQVLGPAAAVACVLVVCSKNVSPVLLALGAGPTKGLLTSYPTCRRSWRQSFAC